jgi:flagellar motility protein MotE (MotC chaperone)
MVNTSIKALALSAILALSGSGLQAQDVPPPPPPTPDEAPVVDSTSTRAARMSAEIAAAISEYSKDMAALQKQIADKDISKEDAERRRKELSKRLEDRLEAIEEMAEAWADNLEQ